MENAAIVSPEPLPVTSPRIGDTGRQLTLHVGPTGVIHRGGVPWHKRLALTKAPSPTAHHVLLTLGSFVSDGQSEAWPSVSTLVSMTGLARRTIQRALRVLEAEHLVQTETVVGRSSRYRLASTCVTGSPLPASQDRPPCVTGSPEGTSEGTKEVQAAAPLPVPVQEANGDEKPKAETKRGNRSVTALDGSTEDPSKPARNTCPCGHSWPRSYGKVCFAPSCNQPKGSTSAGLAAPEPGKYDCLFDEGEPPPPTKGRIQAEYVERLKIARRDKQASRFRYERSDGEWLSLPGGC